MRIVAFLACALVAVPACKEQAAAPRESAAAEDAAAVAVLQLAEPRLEARGAIDLPAKQPEPTAASPVAACALPAAGWSWPCGSRHFGQLAFDPAGRLYLTDADGGLRRYQVHAEGGCRLEEDASFASGGRLSPPPEREVRQRLDSPVHMRSGGPEWRLAAGAGEVYWYDFLLGVYRVDGGTLEPVCPDLTGVRRMAGGPDAMWMVVGGAIERLTAARGCKRTPVEVEGASRTPDLAVVAGALHVTTRHDGERAVVRFSGSIAPEVTFAGVDSFAPGGLCSVAGIAGCGAALCVADNNCQKVNRYAADGNLLATYRLGDVLEHPPYAVRALATAPDGAALVTVEERDEATCTARILRIAPE